MATRRAFLRLILAGLLLVAQHGAISHAVWHLNDFLPAHGQHDGHAGDAHDPEDEQHSSQSDLCVLHFALGTLLSGGCSAQPVVLLPDSAGTAAAPTATWHFALARVAFHSRAPPVFL